MGNAGFQGNWVGVVSSLAVLSAAAQLSSFASKSELLNLALANPLSFYRGVLAVVAFGCCLQHPSSHPDGVPFAFLLFAF